MSFCSRPSRTWSGLSILISCIETFATRFALRCSSCSSGDNWLTSNSSAVPGSAGAAGGSTSSYTSGSRCTTISGSGIRGGGAICAAGFADAGAAECAIGVGTEGCGRTGSGAGSAAVVLIRCEICDSKPERPGCAAMATNRARTSRAAESEAAHVCARSIAGSALVGRELPHAATISPTAWCSSFAFAWMRSRFSRSARDTAWSMAVGSCAILVFRARGCCLASLRQGYSPASAGLSAQTTPSCDSESQLVCSQPPARTGVPNRCLTPDGQESAGARRPIGEKTSHRRADKEDVYKC